MTEKGHQKFVPLKWTFFQKKSPSWSAKNFSVPPNSAPGFRHCPHTQLLNGICSLGSGTDKILRLGKDSKNRFLMIVKVLSRSSILCDLVNSELLSICCSYAFGLAQAVSTRRARRL